eukprot:1162107-Pelagomonas_calceolata.AAC.4
MEDQTSAPHAHASSYGCLETVTGERMKGLSVAQSGRSDENHTSGSREGSRNGKAIAMAA